MLTLADIDHMLESASALDSSTPAARLRGGRDDLVHVAVLLSYARHVLSVDIGALQALTEAPDRDLQNLVDNMPRILEEASIGGGWSLSPDAPATSASARQAVEGAADGLMSAHADVSRIDLRSPEAVRATLRELEAQRALVAECREHVEARCARSRRSSLISTSAARRTRTTGFARPPARAGPRSGRFRLDDPRHGVDECTECFVADAVRRIEGHPVDVTPEPAGDVGRHLFG